MTKDSIWAAMGPSGSLSEDDTCPSLPSPGPREEPSVASLGSLVLLGFSGPELAVRRPGQEGAVACVVAAVFCGHEALDDLHGKKGQELGGHPGLPCPPAPGHSLGAPPYRLGSGCEHCWGAGAALVEWPAPTSASSLERLTCGLGTGSEGGRALPRGWSSRSTSSWKPATIGFPPRASPSLQRRGRAVRGHRRPRAAGSSPPLPAGLPPPPVCSSGET